MAALALGLLLALTPIAMAYNPLRDALRHHCGAAPCPRLGATAALSFSLHGSGAHRQMRYRLMLRCPPAAAQGGGDTAAAPPPPPGCEAALLQPLSPAIFADIYQLDNAAAMGTGPRTRLFGLVDVESIEALAQPTLLAVYGNATAAAAPREQQQVSRRLCGKAGSTCGDCALLAILIVAEHRAAAGCPAPHVAAPHRPLPRPPRAPFIWPAGVRPRSRAGSASACALPPPPLPTAACAGLAGRSGISGSHSRPTAASRAGAVPRRTAP